LQAQDMRHQLHPKMNAAAAGCDPSRAVIVEEQA